VCPKGLHRPVYPRGARHGGSRQRPFLAPPLQPSPSTWLLSRLHAVPLALASGAPGKEVLHPVATVILGGAHQLHRIRTTDDVLRGLEGMSGAGHPSTDAEES